MRSGSRQWVAPLALLAGWIAANTLASAAATAIPPRLDVAPEGAVTNYRGATVELVDREVKFTLYIPEQRALSSNTRLCVHFHTAPSFAIPEHERRKAQEPLAVFSLGSGSSAYRVPFEDTNRFARVLGSVEEELRKREGSMTVRIAGVDISSFSAGYGAVRELVKVPAYRELIHRIILLDSFYGSLLPGAAHRVPSPEHIDVWVPFARAAIEGRKTFVLTTSEVPTETYASTSECASALLERVGLKLPPVAPARSSEPLKLLARVDAGGFHVWSYSGTNGAAHLAHVRHTAEMWNAVDRER